MENQYEQHKKIEKILENFNFEKVHNYYNLVNWEWKDNGINGYIPSVEDLRITARTLFNQIKMDFEETQCIGTGGLYVYKLPWGFKLTFEPFNETSY